VSENRVLIKIFGLNKNEVFEQFMKLRDDEHHDSYGPTSVVKIVKLRRL
jgi:hypothetical protein